MRLLLEAAKILQSLSDDEIGYTPELKNEKPATPDDEELLKRYKQPWCIADPNPYCSALPSMPDYASGVVAGGFNLDCTEKKLGSDLMGLANPFSAIKADGKLIPFAVFFREKQTKAAELFKQAAQEFSKIPREEPLTKYLLALADDFQNNALFPYVKSDAAWLAQNHTPSLITVRAGADEEEDHNIGRDCGTKSRFHMNIALKNFDVVKGADQYEPFVDRWEKAFAALIGDPTLYVAQKVVMKFPEFFDVIMLVGDDIGGPQGTVVGQTLPNWCGEDGKLEPCSRRTLNYFNVQKIISNKEIRERYIFPLINPQDRHYFKSEVDSDNTNLHEIAHNLAPQPGKKKPGTEIDYSEAIGSTWKGTIEEFKAEQAAFYESGDLLILARQKFAAGAISKEDLDVMEESYKEHIVTHMVWNLSQIIRATRTGKFQGGPYAKLAVVQFGFLSEVGAFKFDPKNGWFTPDYERVLQQTPVLMQKLLRLYAAGDSSGVDALFKYYMEGDGFKALHPDRIREVAKDKPSVVIDFQVDLSD